MKSVLRLSLLTLFSFLLVSNPALMAEESGPYYTKLNIWYEKPQKILSTNYHKGTIIPAGSEVEIVKRGRKKIQFKTAKDDMEFTLHLVKKYTDLEPSEFFDRYFSLKNVLSSKEYQAFSSQEKTNVQNGIIEEGMSKQAVLMSYGYPPSHQTPSTESSNWTYWVSRFDTLVAFFKDGKLTRTMT